MGHSASTHLPREATWRLALVGLIAASVLALGTFRTQPAEAQEPYVIELGPRWSLVGYTGPNNTNIADAMEGTDAEGRVTAIYRWIGAEQRWEAWFAAGANTPGANDFSNFERGVAYFVAINGTTPVEWPIETAQ